MIDIITKLETYHPMSSQRVSDMQKLPRISAMLGIAAAFSQKTELPKSATVTPLADTDE